MISITGSGKAMLEKKFPNAAEQILRINYSVSCG